MRYFEIVIPRQKTPILTYRSKLDLKIGDMVCVPFRNEKITGTILSENTQLQNQSPKYIIKDIEFKFDSFSLSKNFLSFIEKFSKYYLVDLASCCKMILPIKIKKEELEQSANPDIEEITEPNLPLLNEGQQRSYEEISLSKKVSLLQGVTGSGKTEIYFHLIADFLKQNKQVLVMLPEIGLTSQLMERFAETFNFKPLMWHSAISPSKKRKIFNKIIDGSAKVVIGTRSSLFLPYKKLGLIVIDEEHDGAYKQEENILYNARDAAILRASLDGIKIILVSATPSLETYQNCLNDKYQYSVLTSRYGKAKMPSINIVDMKKQGKDRWISAPLTEAINKGIASGLQSLLFINRRGYAPLMLCASCGYRAACNNCSSWLVVHKRKNLLICHHCGHEEKMQKHCPNCLSENLISCGPGVERIEEEARKLFPESRIQILTREEANSDRSMEEIIENIENSKIDIIIGTQIITKGYHFPKISTVGIIDADLGNSNIDLKANERCFQILQQVSGRAGRDEFEGSVYIQTYYPENNILNILSNNLVKDFYEIELKNREQNFFPPFSRIIAIIIAGGSELEALNFGKQMVRSAGISQRVRILGPAPATMSKLRGAYRFRILAIADKNFNLQSYVTEWISKNNSPNNINIRVEVDPYSFY